MNFILTTLACALAVNLVMFLIAFWRQTDTLTDSSYAITFMVLAGYGVATGGWALPHIVGAAMVVLWAARLGSYLAVRIKKIGKDKRFDGIREDFWKFGGFWLWQGFTAWLIMLPLLFLFAEGAVRMNVFAWLGVAVWLTGLSIEAIADWQKYRFINNPANQGKWIEEGLWRYSRHPNYFGEIVVWLGVYIFAIPMLTALPAALGALSPLYIAGLLIFFSGIPPLERAAEKKWGDNNAYQQYKRRTNVLIPWFPKNS